MTDDLEPFGTVTHSVDNRERPGSGRPTPRMASKPKHPPQELGACGWCGRRQIEPHDECQAAQEAAEAEEAAGQEPPADPDAFIAQMYGQAPLCSTCLAPAPCATHAVPYTTTVVSERERAAEYPQEDE